LAALRAPLFVGTQNAWGASPQQFFHGPFYNLAITNGSLKYFDSSFLGVRNLFSDQLLFILIKKNRKKG
jgi:hypothetical protein